MLFFSIVICPLPLSNLNRRISYSQVILVERKKEGDPINPKSIYSTNGDDTDYGGLMEISNSDAPSVWITVPFRVAFPSETTL